MRLLLKRAYLTGAEYAGALDPDANFDLWGVDDPTLYRKNSAAAVQVELIRDGVARGASEMKRAILRTCQGYLTPDLWDLIDLRERIRRALSDMEASDLAWRLLFYATAYS